MAKFGELITTPTPVLLYFYKGLSESNKNQDMLLKVASNFGVKTKIFKINIDKNIELSQALKVNTSPTYIIYQDEVMKWRTHDVISTDKLINTLEKFITE